MLNDVIRLRALLKRLVYFAVGFALGFLIHP